MWLCRKSRRPAVEAAKIPYSCHTLISFLREKHQNSEKSKRLSEPARKRIINELDGRREGRLMGEWKKGGYQNQVEREEMCRWVGRAGQHQRGEKREQRWRKRRLWQVYSHARGTLGKKKCLGITNIKHKAAVNLHELFRLHIIFTLRRSVRL